MNDPHLNIFHVYRHSSETEDSRERQLEDNLTRALAIVLQFVRATPAQYPLLRALGVPQNNCDEPFQCHLQVREAAMDWPLPSARRLTVIHGGSSLAIQDAPSGALRGRADAVIESRRSIVAIESKLGWQVSRSQLDRHRETLDLAHPDRHDVSWSHLARTVRGIREDTRSAPVVDFVLQQFEEYLRMNGFGGLTEDHLSYFALRPEHRDDLVKEGIRRSLHALMTELRERWETHWTYRVGNIHANDSAAWAKLEPSTRGHSPHLSMGFDPAGMELFANIETAEPYKRFRTTWKQNPDGLIEVVRALASGWPPPSASDPAWRLSVLRRIQVRPRKFDAWPSADVALATMVSWPERQVREFIEAVTATPAGESAPEIKIVRTFPAPTIINDRDLAGRLVTSARELEPFFEWLGVPVRD